jgi:hypothetical protein
MAKTLAERGIVKGSPGVELLGFLGTERPNPTAGRDILGLSKTVTFRNSRMKKLRRTGLDPDCFRIRQRQPPL